MALSRVVSEIFNVENCRDIEIWVRGHSRSSKEVPIYTGYGFLLVFYRNFVPNTHRFEIFAFSNTVTSKSGTKVTEGH